jgi:hypothetical protein
MSMLILVTIRRGSTGAVVVAWQKLIHVVADGDFGPKTEAATKTWQDGHGLVADGIVGPKSWAAALGADGTAPTIHADPRARACLAALRDANKRWPNRKSRSDGIMGDAAHQLRPSDHNDGNAVDITHDVASGADGPVIADHALHDARTKYVIWNHRIWTKSAGWQPYTSSNAHTHHVHISILTEQARRRRSLALGPRRLM